MKPQLTLGTVRFGSIYGINNNGKTLTEKEVFEILDISLSNNVKSLDTADSYNGSIDLIAKYNKHNKIDFNLTTKFVYTNKTNLKNHFEVLLEKLNLNSIHTLLLHDFNDLIKSPRCLEILLELKQNKIVKNIGVSIYTNEELEYSSNINDLDTIQIPFNLLDNRNLRGGIIDLAIDQRKKIQVRSVFLQGLFFKPIETLPKKLISLEIYLKQIIEICNNFKITITELSLMYAMYSYNFESILIGVEDKKQLLNNLNIYQKIKPISDIFQLIENIKVENPKLLNPINWS